MKKVLSSPITPIIIGMALWGFISIVAIFSNGYNELTSEKVNVELAISLMALTMIGIPITAVTLTYIRGK